MRGCVRVPGCWVGSGASAPSAVCPAVPLGCEAGAPVPGPQQRRRARCSASGASRVAGPPAPAHLRPPPPPQTFVNDVRIPDQKYVTLKLNDVIRFGYDILPGRPPLLASPSVPRASVALLCWKWVGASGG